MEVGNESNLPPRGLVNENCLVMDSLEGVDPSELTVAQQIERDLAQLERDKSFNQFMYCLGSDVVQEFVDVYGSQNTADAIADLVSKQTPKGPRTSVYWLVRSLAVRIDQDTKQGREAILDNVNVKLRSNHQKYMTRLANGHVSPAEAEFQLPQGYDTRWGYITKQQIVDHAFRLLGMPDSVVALGAVVRNTAYFKPDTSYIGIAIETNLHGFDKKRFVADLAQNDNDLIATYLAGNQNNARSREEIVQRSIIEMERLSDEINVAQHDSDPTYLNTLQAQRSRIVSKMRSLGKVFQPQPQTV